MRCAVSITNVPIIKYSAKCSLTNSGENSVIHGEMISLPSVSGRKRSLPHSDFHLQPFLFRWRIQNKMHFAGFEKRGRASFQAILGR